MLTPYFPVIDLAATGSNIRRLRMERGLTVRDLQTYFGFEEPRAIYKWQKGESLPTVDNLYALGSLFEVPMEQILVPVIQLHKNNEQQESTCCSVHFTGIFAAWFPASAGMNNGPVLTAQRTLCEYFNHFSNGFRRGQRSFLKHLPAMPGRHCQALPPASPDKPGGGRSPGSRRERILADPFPFFACPANGIRLYRVIWRRKHKRGENGFGVRTDRSAGRGVLCVALKARYPLNIPGGFVRTGSVFDYAALSFICT